MAKRTLTAGRVTVDGNVRCERIVPVEDKENTPCPANHGRIWKRATVAIRLNKEQAIHLARVLLAMTQDLNEIWITGFRYQRRKDETYPVTVTGPGSAEED
jgi:hypothetical protein